MEKHCWSFPHHKKVQENASSHHSLIYNCIKHLLSFTIFKTLSKETMIKLWQTSEKWVSKDLETSRMAATNGLCKDGLHTGGCQSSLKVLSPVCPWRKGTPVTAQRLPPRPADAFACWYSQSSTWTDFLEWRPLSRNPFLFLLSPSPLRSCF